MIRGHSCDGAVMFKTGRVEYNGRVVIFIGVDMMVYVVASASVTIIIIIGVIIISRDVALIGLVFIWFGVGEFKSQSFKELQGDRELPRETLDQLANTRGERECGPREAGTYAAIVEVEEVVPELDFPGGAERQRLEHTVLHGFAPVLVSVDILSKLEEGMLSELGGLAINDSSWD